MGIRGRFLACGLAVLALALLGGCIKIRLTVRLNEDGSGQVIEDLVYGEKLVNVSKRIKNAPTIEMLTGEERINQRLANMGKDVSLVGKKIEQLPDGSMRHVVTYAFKDVANLKLAPVPFGQGWEEAYLKFTLADHTTIANATTLTVQLTAQRTDRPETEALGEVETQQIRQLLPIFRDLLEGFELSLRLEVFNPDQWACATRGHPQAQTWDLSKNAGRLTFYQITDTNLFASEDGMLMIVPWRQIGREFDLYHYGWPPGPRIMPYVNYIEGNRFTFSWRAIQGPHRREYY